MREVDFQSRPCEVCGEEVCYPPQASASVCIPCPCCGHRSCAN